MLHRHHPILLSLDLPSVAVGRNQFVPRIQLGFDKYWLRYHKLHGHNTQECLNLVVPSKQVLLAKRH